MTERLVQMSIKVGDGESVTSRVFRNRSARQIIESVVTGLKCAPLSGPNTSISTYSPPTVASVLASSTRPALPPDRRSAMMPEPMTAAILSNNRIHAPFGMAGGSPGATGINRVVSPVHALHNDNQEAQLKALYDEFAKNLSRHLKLSPPELYTLFKFALDAKDQLSMKKLFKGLGGA